MKVYLLILGLLATSPLWGYLIWIIYEDWRDARNLKRYGRDEIGRIKKKP